MTPKSLAKYAEIKFIFDDNNTVTGVRNFSDEPGIVCILCKNTVSEYHRIADLFICRTCWAEQ